MVRRNETIHAAIPIDFSKCSLQQVKIFLILNGSGIV